MGTRNQSYNPLLKSYPDSEKINRLSIGAEAFYVRLVACTDDAARYWADPAIVMARLYTLRMVNGTVTVHDIDAWIKELAREALIEVYMVEGRRYLQMTNPFKTFRSDVKKNIVFPARNESGTNAGRTRNESGTAGESQQNEHVTLDPDPHQTHTTPDPDTINQSPAANGVVKDKPPDDASRVPIPEPLDTEPFRKAWQDWIDDRRDRKKKMTVRAATLQLSRLLELGHDRAITAIEHSVANGYTGIFEPRGSGGFSGGTANGSGNGAAHRRAEQHAREFEEPALQIPRL